MFLISSFYACKNNSLDSNWYYLDTSGEDTLNYCEAYIDSNRISYMLKHDGLSPIFHFVIKNNEVYYGTPDDRPAFKLSNIKENSFVVESWISYTDSIKTYRNKYYRLDNSVKGIFDRDFNYDTLFYKYRERYEEFLIKNKYATKKEIEEWYSDTIHIDYIYLDLSKGEIIPIVRPDSATLIE